MRINYPFLCFYFQNNFVVNYKIGKKIMRKNNVFIFYFILFFAFIRNLFLVEFIFNSVFVNYF